MASNQNLKEISCLACGGMISVDAGVSTGICGTCMTKLVGAPTTAATRAGVVKVPKLTKAGVPRKRRGEGVKKAPSGFPRGWHFKIFYKHTDGKCYSKGKLVEKAALIKKLAEKQARKDKAKA